MNDLWTFNLDRLMWAERTAQSHGEIPSGRRSPGVAVVSGRVFVHGGYGGQECLGDHQKCGECGSPECGEKRQYCSLNKSCISDLVAETMTSLNLGLQEILETF